MFRWTTDGMTAKERRDWWVSHPEGEGGMKATCDLGPELHIPKGKMKLHKPRRDKTEWEEECADTWYKEGTVTNGIALHTLTAYSKD